MKYFISGHLDLTQEEFNIHYLAKIADAVNANASFVICDAKGADTMAQNYLDSIGYEDVMILHMFDKPRTVCLPCFDYLGGFQSDEQRDSWGTAASDADICWVRPGREKSGTAKNVLRRMKNNENNSY